MPLPIRILVVEDEALIAMGLAAALKDHAFEVLGPAGTLAAATELLESAMPDGVLLDINLQGETSYPLARACIARGIWFAFVTAVRADSIPHDLRTVPRLAKPWSRDDLQRLMEARFG
jgi:DNA-binding NarL/FixJ family response regulator